MLNSKYHDFKTIILVIMKYIVTVAVLRKSVVTLYINAPRHAALLT